MDIEVLREEARLMALKVQLAQLSSGIGNSGPDMFKFESATPGSSLTIVHSAPGSSTSTDNSLTTAMGTLAT